MTVQTKRMIALSCGIVSAITLNVAMWTGTMNAITLLFGLVSMWCSYLYLKDTRQVARRAKRKRKAQSAYRPCTSCHAGRVMYLNTITGDLEPHTCAVCNGKGGVKL